MGEPLVPPDILLPKLGPALAAFACVLVVIAVFLVWWIFGNDMKVARTFLVYLLGDGTTFTKSLLSADPKLPYYRIFSYDAFRLGFMLSFGMIPLSLVGIWLARRAMRLARHNPARFGGASLARTSLVLSSMLCLIFSAVAIGSVPGAIERGRAKHQAATCAAMYQLHQLALQRYYKEYGSYPQELSDLSRVAAESVSQTDYWQHPLNYQPVGVIASKGSAISFSNYKLVSVGADGIFGTPDDITMVDGVIVPGPSDGDLPTLILPPGKSR